MTPHCAHCQIWLPPSSVACYQCGRRLQYQPSNGQVGASAQSTISQIPFPSTQYQPISGQYGPSAQSNFPQTSFPSAQFQFNPNNSYANFGAGQPQSASQLAPNAITQGPPVASNPWQNVLSQESNPFVIPNYGQQPSVQAQQHPYPAQLPSFAPMQGSSAFFAPDFGRQPLLQPQQNPFLVSALVPSVAQAQAPAQGSAHQFVRPASADGEARMMQMMQTFQAEQDRKMEERLQKMQHDQMRMFQEQLAGLSLHSTEPQASVATGPSDPAQGLAATHPHLEHPQSRDGQVEDDLEDGVGTDSQLPQRLRADGGAQDRWCLRCSFPGHWARSCPQPASFRVGSTRRPSAWTRYYINAPRPTQLRTFRDAISMYHEMVTHLKEIDLWRGKRDRVLNMAHGVLVETADEDTSSEWRQLMAKCNAASFNLANDIEKSLRVWYKEFIDKPVAVMMDNDPTQYKTTMQAFQLIWTRYDIAEYIDVLGDEGRSANFDAVSANARLTQEIGLLLLRYRWHCSRYASDAQQMIRQIPEGTRARLMKKTVLLTVEFMFQVPDDMQIIGKALLPLAPPGPAYGYFDSQLPQ
ncbi:hypothetical protein LTR10_021246 [Elasticomyces elasticus]|uniref:CCHC-type domain-containing protein n=1 Tax=Exophiala sideris TaxID=1016849 RepID=A0ABR0JFN0_9EURO|nr:hypothetical protein LTR10_021246 [Elasticomyces elasticus]KAK5025359.1 hypothetical protein LTS07_008210 [Exophiala sideris]KAK5032934.1 hypothetical protein LTR13_006899 [Exophiala sideris]KAK5063419.1 hypothetical protein LTR69_004125 [Exophiala sideris]KAK5180748.1 hypothetical protein LTR44_007062 [Eurotiomycetes sp. CCFEE 6388]